MRDAMDLAKLKSNHAGLIQTRSNVNRRMLELREQLRDHEITLAHLDGQIHQSAQTISAFEPAAPAIVPPATKTPPAKTDPSKK